MTMQCSWSTCEGHHHWHSATIMQEPPSHNSPVSTLDEGACCQGSQACWGNNIEIKQPGTVQVIFQNTAGLSQQKEEGNMKLTMANQWLTHNAVDILDVLNSVYVGM